MRRALVVPLLVAVAVVAVVLTTVMPREVPSDNAPARFVVDDAIDAAIARIDAENGREPASPPVVAAPLPGVDDASGPSKPAPPEGYSFVHSAGAMARAARNLPRRHATGGSSGLDRRTGVHPHAFATGRWPGVDLRLGAPGRAAGARRPTA